MNRRAAVIALPLLLSSLSLAVGMACSEFQSAPDAADATDAPDATDAADATAASDAGSDAASSPCVGAEHFLCADFNEEPYTKGWTEELSTEGGTLALDPTVFVSAPSSLHATVATLDTTGTGAVLMKRVGVTPRGITLSFAFRVEKTSSFAADLAAIELGDVPGGDGAYLLMTGTDIEAQLSLQVVNHVDGDLDRTDHVIPFGVATREWHTVTMVLSLPDPVAQGTISVAVDGREGTTASAALRAPTAGARASVGLTHFSNIYPVHDVHIDDVVMDVTQQ